MCKSTFVNRALPQPRSPSFMTSPGSPGTAPPRRLLGRSRTFRCAIPAVWFFDDDSEFLPENPPASQPGHAESGRRRGGVDVSRGHCRRSSIAAMVLRGQRCPLLLQSHQSVSARPGVWPMAADFWGSAWRTPTPSRPIPRDAPAICSISDWLPAPPRPSLEGESRSIAIIGRPNVGKSSLLMRSAASPGDRQPDPCTTRGHDRHDERARKANWKLLDTPHRLAASVSYAPNTSLTRTSKAWNAAMSVCCDRRPPPPPPSTASRQDSARCRAHRRRRPAPAVWWSTSWGRHRKDSHTMRRWRRSCRQALFPHWAAECCSPPPSGGSGGEHLALACLAVGAAPRSGHHLVVNEVLQEG